MLRATCGPKVHILARLGRFFSPAPNRPSAYERIDRALLRAVHPIWRFGGTAFIILTR